LHVVSILKIKDEVFSDVCLVVAAILRLGYFHNTKGWAIANTMTAHREKEQQNQQ